MIYLRVLLVGRRTFAIGFAMARDGPKHCRQNARTRCEKEICSTAIIYFRFRPKSGNPVLRNDHGYLSYYTRSANAAIVLSYYYKSCLESCSRPLSFSRSTRSFPPASTGRRRTTQQRYYLSTYLSIYIRRTHIFIYILRLAC